MRIIAPICIWLLFFGGTNPYALVSEKEKPKTEKENAATDFCRDVVGVFDEKDQTSRSYIFDQQIYENNCQEISQVIFWRRIMNLSKDSAIISIAHNRQMLAGFSVKAWQALSDAAKDAYRDSLRMTLQLDSSHRILITEGKSYFYDFNKAYENLHRGIEDFYENGVDPWYAQAILLIESPNRLQKSNVGAYGPFQLMKPVARMYGLKVNKHQDERADFDRAAYAASMLMKNICIPKVKDMLDTLHISYKETDLWFRLLVMHTYHAGAGNVRAALGAIRPTEGGMQLIQTLWQTQAKGFRTASQNYSQLVLAAMLEMNDRVWPRLSIARN